MKSFLFKTFLWSVAFYLLLLNTNVFKQKNYAVPNMSKFGISTAKDANLEPIVRLSYFTGEGFCTAFVVDVNYAITAAHCLIGKEKDTLSLYDKEGNDLNVFVKVTAYDISTDLGLISGDFTRFKPLDTEFNGEGFVDKHEYISCGYPHGQNHLTCSRFYPTNFNYFKVEGTGHLIPGYSGGPTIDLTTGKAVGVNHAVTDHSVLIIPVQGLLGVFGIEND